MAVNVRQLLSRSDGLGGRPVHHPHHLLIWPVGAARRGVTAFCVGGFLLAACGESSLPPSTVSRISAAGNVFSLAVPDGWSDVTDAHGGSNSSPYQVSGDHQLVVAPRPPANGTVTVAWSRDQVGMNSAGDLVSLTISGTPITGLALGGYITGDVQHTVDGQPRWFHFICQPGVSASTCEAVIDSWIWEPPSAQNRAVPIAAGVLGVALLGGGVALVFVIRRRRAAYSG